MPNSALVWLRRDLRLNDNLALYHAVKSGAKIAVVFVIDDAILLSPRVSAARVAFMCQALNFLDAELREFGSRLIIRRGRPAQEIAHLARELHASAVYANMDYTPYARKRDAAVGEALGDIPLRMDHDRLLLAPGSILTDVGNPYTVFTPFSKKWHRLAKNNPAPVDVDVRGAFLDLSAIESLPPPTAASLGFSTSVSLPEASHAAAMERVHTFTSDRIYAYKDTRNFLADPFVDPRSGTSSLSPYIRWGLISPRQIHCAAADAVMNAPDAAGRESVSIWLNEIVWYEFYACVLWHYPHVKTRNFKAGFDGIAWRSEPDDFSAWADGRTGYPIVDAAMRQLSATGWMHNRARMIVASFLTKDLLIDWRVGELYFMQCLLDGDLAANNGGWQWAAGTGTDAQPYFRIFNPVAQSERFDPDGIFIRRWIPELGGVPGKYVHAPWAAPSPPPAYPQPIVDHAFARQRALDAFSLTKT